MSLCCQRDTRRRAVRHRKDWNGLDYVEVTGDERTIEVYFLGKLPPELREDRPGLERYLRLEGGQRITGIQITGVTPVADPDPEKDDYLTVRLDKSGDFSTYTLRLVDVAQIDPRYDRAVFTFKLDCSTDLDCLPKCACEPERPLEPAIDYLAKDYASFRQLMLDRLSLLLPQWTERHAPDLGIALVELLAYTGDYLSYYQDAVATEAYLDTARQRISVRRHARLVDYLLHEGCNARAWVCVEVGADLQLDPTEAAFITGLNEAPAVRPTVVTWADLSDVPVGAYEVFEPLVGDRSVPIQLCAAHNEIHFYTWGEKECCLERGTTSATLRDAWVSGQPPGEAKPHAAGAAPKRRRALDLQVGDVLIFEEVVGPGTGLAADADPRRRHAVRLVRVTPGEDPVYTDGSGAPTPYVGITWAAEDALPFTLCLSTIGPAPDCRYLEHITVARGNVILVDHGRTQEPEDLGTVPVLTTEAVCECVGQPGDVRTIPGGFHAALRHGPLTFREPLASGRPGKPAGTSATALLRQDVSVARPEVWLTSDPTAAWESRYDLLASGSDDRHFVVELDNDRVAHLRFGNGESGFRPPPGMSLRATYRVGNGVGGNVGPEAISRLVLGRTRLSGVTVAPRNPLPARGGTDPEPIAEAKLFAPHLFRKRLDRAISAADYAELAERHGQVQRAAARLAWNGSWYEADVAIDPRGRESPPRGLLADLARYLQTYRRMGHDLGVRPAPYVPLAVKLEACALPHYDRGQVKAALLDAFSTRTLPGGKRGFFHPDNLTFGEGIYLSRIVATAQAVPGVECVRVTSLHRLFRAPDRELDDGVLPLQPWEIAQLDNDPNFPERGTLVVEVRGGR